MTARKQTGAVVCGNCGRPVTVAGLCAFCAARAPGYWRDETSGALRPAVEAYLAGGPLAGAEIAALRAYLRQWIGSPVWDQNPYADEAQRAWLAKLRADIDGLTNWAAIADWIDEATEFGLDPL